jgi:hypothetical protein
VKTAITWEAYGGAQITCGATGAGGDNGIDHNENPLRFPYVSEFLRPHYLHPHPYHRKKNSRQQQRTTHQSDCIGSHLGCNPETTPERHRPLPGRFRPQYF